MSTPDDQSKEIGHEALLAENRRLREELQVARQTAEAALIQLDQDLQRRISELETLFNTVPIGLSIAYDAAGKRIRGNQAMEQILGVAPGGELSKGAPQPVGFRCFYEGRELAVAELPMQRAVRGETVIGQITDVVREDGQTVTVYSSARPLYDEAGKPRGAVGAFLDISPLKRAEEQLHQSRRRLAWVLEATGVGLWLNELPLSQLNWDQRTRELFFVPPDSEPTIELFWERLHPDDREPTLRAVEAALRNRALYAIDHRAVNPATGEIHWIRSAGRATYDAAGKPVRFDGINYDITDRKRAEESLGRTVERVGLLSEVASQLLAATQPQQAVETVCRKVMEHLDCQVFFNFLVDDGRERLRLNACAGIAPEARGGVEWLDMARALCGRSVQEKRAIVVENLAESSEPGAEHIRASGVRAYACHPLINEGVAIGTLSFGSRNKLSFSEDELGLMQAVSDQIALAIHRTMLRELAEQRAAQAEAASVAKTQFLANMSHELRTPMNAILGMIDVALPRAGDPVVLDCLRTAKGSADLLLTLLNDLLDSAKIESGKLELESTPFSLRRMLDQIRQILSVRASEKGLTYYCRLASDTPDAIVGDRIRLQQVLLNLAGNAIKFTESGEVEINVRGAVRGDEAELAFAVRDTGIGILPCHLEQIFQPFAQADASTARRFGGTGLGLSISQRLVAMMGGAIHAESVVGRGSTFAFDLRLPLATELPPDFDAPLVIPPHAARPLRLLLVEDNPANQKLTTYILQDRGHTVEIAGDGHEAVFLTERNRYDAILMDVQMPGMDGLEATAIIRRRDGENRRVPIIAMTAHAMSGDRERCLAAGMDAYISKPINAREVIGLVESVAGDLVANLAFGHGSDCLAAAGPQAVFNHGEAVARCCNDPDMLKEMAECFLDEAANLLPRMRSALDRSDLAELGRLGHRMKGTVVYLGAPGVEQAALAVEHCDKDVAAGPQSACAAVSALERACSELAAALRQQRLIAG